MKKILIILIILSSSCAPKIKNFQKYQKQFLSKSDFMPNKEELEGKAIKVAVFSFETNENKVVIESGLQNSIANNIENILSQNRLAEIVDRTAVEKLQKEIVLAEMNKTGSYNGPIIADYAISGAISNAAFSSKYSDGSTYVDPRNLNVITIPPRYTYNADVAGNIKIYELPSLTVAHLIEFNGRKVRSENVKQNGGISIGALQIGGEKADGAERDDGLVRKAAEDAIDEIKTEIKNIFARRGFILEKRSLDKKNIFKISLGSSHGIKQSDEFEIIAKYESSNAITNESEVETRIIATGKVSDKVEPEYSWVILNDKDSENLVRLGDKVKMKYKKSRFSSIAKATNNLVQ